jgi:hypothetical protein
LGSDIVQPVPFGMYDFMWHSVKYVVVRLKGRVVCFLSFLFLTIFLAGSFANSRSSYAEIEVYSDEHLQVLQAILDVSPLAPGKLAKLKRNQPNHPATVYLENYSAFIAFIALEKPIDAQTFPILAQQRTKQIDQMVGDAAAAVYNSNIMLQLAIVEAINGHNVQSLKAVVKAMQLVKKIPNEVPFYHEREKLSIVFDLFWAVVPDDYKWALNLWGISVDWQQSVARLGKYVSQAQSQIGLGDEAKIIESLVYLKATWATKGFLLPKHNALGKPLLIYVDGLLGLKIKQQEMVLPLIGDDVCRLFPPLYYIRGRMKLNVLDESAANELRSYLDRFDGNSFKADALLRLAWCDALTGERQNTSSFVSLMAKLSTPLTYADKQALSEIKQINRIDTTLLKARLLFDAGIYQKSLALLVDNKQLKAVMPCEYFYRMARAQHELGLSADALSNYRCCIENNTSPQRYFAPNAALKAAELLFVGNAMEPARQMVKLCLELNQGEYAESIKAEAQALLKAINKGEH